MAKTCSQLSSTYCEDKHVNKVQPLAMCEGENGHCSGPDFPLSDTPLHVTHALICTGVLFLVLAILFLPSVVA